MTRLTKAMVLLVAALPATALAKDARIAVPSVNANGNPVCASGYEVENIETKTLREGKPATALYSFCRDTTESRVRWIGRIAKVRDAMLEDARIGDWEKQEIRTAFADYIRQQRIR